MQPTQHLDLDSVFFPAIKSRTKTLTVRMGSRLGIRADEPLELRINGNKLCVVFCVSVKPKQLVDVTRDERIQDCGYDTLENMLAEFYHRFFKPEDLVTVIKWRYLE